MLSRCAYKIPNSFPVFLFKHRVLVVRSMKMAGAYQKHQNLCSGATQLLLRGRITTLEVT